MTVSECCLIKSLPYIFLKKIFLYFSIEIAGQGNRHCANCIGTLSFPWLSGSGWYAASVRVGLWVGAQLATRVCACVGAALALHDVLVADSRPRRLGRRLRLERTAEHGVERRHVVDAHRRPVDTSAARVVHRRDVTLSTSRRSASYARRQRGTARIRPPLLLSAGRPEIDQYLLPAGPQQQTVT